MRELSLKYNCASAMQDLEIDNGKPKRAKSSQNVRQLTEQIPLADPWIKQQLTCKNKRLEIYWQQLSNNRTPEKKLKKETTSH